MRRPETPRFAPGFRLSGQDAVVLFVGLGGSIALGKLLWPASLITVVSVGHFFLFCNVFRISRRLELIWTGVFVVLSLGTITADFPGWPAALTLSACVTAIVVRCEMKKPSYHGVGWQRINPKLRDWWDGNATKDEIGRAHV